MEREKSYKSRSSELNSRVDWIKILMLKIKSQEFRIRRIMLILGDLTNFFENYIAKKALNVSKMQKI
ncbi:hypothetical protein [Acinetobacter sp. G18]|uniref:hypothetical protein n=1 Tax=Acinetobacter sp. G18 TaxID=2952152 RepID=UPI004043BD5B